MCSDVIQDLDVLRGVESDGRLEIPRLMRARVQGRSMLGRGGGRSAGTRKVRNTRPRRTASKIFKLFCFNITAPTIAKGIGYRRVELQQLGLEAVSGSS